MDSSFLRFSTSIGLFVVAAVVAVFVFTPTGKRSLWRDKTAGLMGAEKGKERQEDKRVKYQHLFKGLTPVIQRFPMPPSVPPWLSWKSLCQSNWP